MPKTTMALTIAASILRQVIGSRAERYSLKAIAEKKLAPIYTSIPVSDLGVDNVGHCGDTAEWKTISMEVKSSTSSTQHWSTMANKIPRIFLTKCSMGVLWTICRRPPIYSGSNTTTSRLAMQK